jgi:hypothetical protein
MPWLTLHTGETAYAWLRSRAQGRSATLTRALCGAVLLGGCVQASQVYPLESPTGQANSPQGSVQIERIEGDQRLLAVRLEELSPPETWGPGYTLFVAWVGDSHGRTVKMGALSYDRARRSGTLLGAVEGIDFQAFTVKVTAEREAGASVPSQVLLSERQIKNQ